MIPLLLIRLGSLDAAGVGKATSTDTQAHSASVADSSPQAATSSDAGVGTATIDDDP